MFTAQQDDNQTLNLTQQYFHAAQLETMFPERPGSYCQHSTIHAVQSFPLWGVTRSKPERQITSLKISTRVFT